MCWNLCGCVKGMRSSHSSLAVALPFTHFVAIKNVLLKLFTFPEAMCHFAFLGQWKISRHPLPPPAPQLQTSTSGWHMLHVSTNLLKPFSEQIKRHLSRHNCSAPALFEIVEHCFHSHTACCATVCGCCEPNYSWKRANNIGSKAFDLKKME